MKAASLRQVAAYCERLRRGLNQLARQIGPIQIGSARQFPDGWGKAAKGRTVWRIVEEAITQNLKQAGKALGFDAVSPSRTEASVFDVVVRFRDDPRELHLNFKAAVESRETAKGDVSKAERLTEFFRAGRERQLFIVTFVIAFHPDMTIEIKRCLVTPIAWLPDLYVNPSNNGNLQCSHPKDLRTATRRTNARFLRELEAAITTANQKRTGKHRPALPPP